MSRAAAQRSWPFPGVVLGDYPERPAQAASPRRRATLSWRQLNRFAAAAAAAQPQCLSVKLRGGAEIDLSPENLESFAGLKNIGVRFVLDQFGGPDSSVLQLRRLPVDEVKLHPQFFRPDGAGRDLSPVAAATFALVRTLGVRSVATGIESASQLDLLQAQHCDGYQGPLLGPAVPASAFAAKWLGATAIAGLNGT